MKRLSYLYLLLNTSWPLAQLDDYYIRISAQLFCFNPFISIISSSNVPRAGKKLQVHILDLINLDTIEKLCYKAYL